MKKLVIFIVFSFLGSHAAWGKVFDFENKLEIGLGVGYNNDYYNLSNSRIRPRGTAAGSGALKRRVISLNNIANCFPDTDNDPTTPSSPPVSIEGNDGNSFRCSGGGSGTGSSLTGFNFDLNINYHIFPWLFFRTGFGADIGLPVKHRFTQTTRVDLAPAGLGRHPVQEDLTIKTSSIGFEIPILAGFNLMRTKNSNTYVAVGVHLSLGGYKDELSGIRDSSLDQETADRLAGNITSTGLTADQFIDTVYDTVTNEINEFVLGIQWIIGFRYILSETLSFFAEVKFLSSSLAAAQVKGTSNVTNPASESLLAAAIAGSPVVLDDSDANLSTIGNSSTNRGFDLSYTRWTLGLSYEINL